MTKNNKNLVHKIKKREVEYTIIAVIILLCIVLVSLYFVFTAFNKNKNYNIYKVGDLEVKYRENSNEVEDTINIVDSKVIDDKDINNVKPLTIYIKNTKSRTQKYSIYIEKDEEMIKTDKCNNKQYQTKYLKYKMDNSKTLDLKKMTNKYNIYTGNIKANAEEKHNIRVWLSKSLLNNKKSIKGHFHAKVVVHTNNEKNIIP